MTNTDEVLHYVSKEEKIAMVSKKYNGNTNEKSDGLTSVPVGTQRKHSGRECKTLQWDTRNQVIA